MMIVNNCLLKKQTKIFPKMLIKYQTEKLNTRFRCKFLCRDFVKHRIEYLLFNIKHRLDKKLKFELKNYPPIKQKPKLLIYITTLLQKKSIELNKPKLLTHITTLLQKKSRELNKPKLLIYITTLLQKKSIKLNQQTSTTYHTLLQKGLKSTPTNSYQNNSNTHIYNNNSNTNHKYLIETFKNFICHCGLPRKIKDFARNDGGSNIVTASIFDAWQSIVFKVLLIMYSYIFHLLQTSFARNENKLFTIKNIYNTEFLVKIKSSMFNNIYNSDFLVQTKSSIFNKTKFKKLFMFNKQNQPFMFNKQMIKAEMLTIDETGTIAGIGGAFEKQGFFAKAQEIISNALSNGSGLVRNCLKKASSLKGAVPVAMLIFGAANADSLAQGRYVTGDFHQHTTYTDGDHTIGYVMEASNRFGLDWWANSEHGGRFNRWGMASGRDLISANAVTWDNVNGVTLKGNVTDNRMWRWQSIAEHSFQDVLFWRRVFPNRIIFQALEFNPPGHEHASVGIIGNQFNANEPDANAVAIFEYLFDAADTDDSQPFGITTPKNFVNDHKKCLEAAKWLQDNYQYSSWFVPAHPERFRYESGQVNYHGWNIEHFRDLNNVAPDVFFGFESIPGHQGNNFRGEYQPTRGAHGSYGMTTYGGAGLMIAKVGGLWDALLSEDRKFWLFASSDFHVFTNQFHPGEYQKTYTYVETFTPQGIVDGLRSGNGYVVHGDLIDTLQFTIGNAVMGQTHNAQPTNGQITISIRLRVPPTNNNTYGPNVPVLHHFDIIAGEVTGKITPPTTNPTDPATYPADGKTGYSDAYRTDSVSTTKVIARFGKAAAGADPCGVATTAWTEQAGGFITASFSYTVPQSQKMYFRLRGTNHPLGTENETDACGNPLSDSLMHPNNHAKAFEDLWFYTNPVYASNGYVGISQPIEDDDDVQIYPNPTSDIFYIEGADVLSVSVYNTLGELVQSGNVVENSFDITKLPKGVYSVRIETNDGRLITKSIVKQ